MFWLYFLTGFKDWLWHQWLPAPRHTLLAAWWSPCFSPPWPHMWRLALSHLRCSGLWRARPTGSKFSQPKNLVCAVARARSLFRKESLLWVLLLAEPRTSLCSREGFEVLIFWGLWLEDLELVVDKLLSNFWDNLDSFAVGLRSVVL